MTDRPKNGRAPAWDGHERGAKSKATASSLSRRADTGNGDLARAIESYREAHPIADVVGIDADTDRAELHGPCPMCGGIDRLVVRVRDARAFCRQCGREGDSLRWAMMNAGIDPGASGATARYLREAGYLDDAAATAKNGRAGKNVHHAPPAGNGFASAREAAEWAARNVSGTIAGVWMYRDADGCVVGAMVRIDTDRDPRGKTYRPLRCDDGRWRIGDPPGPWPLYRLREALASDGVVMVVEGERCADTAAELGFVAVASAHGSQSASKSDWAPLAGRECVVLPDADGAGEKYAADVVSILHGLTPPARVKIVRLPGLADGGDIANFGEIRRAEEKSDDEIRAEIVGIIGAAGWMPTPTPKPKPGSVDSVCMADVAAEQVRWVWPNRIPAAKLTLLEGDPSTGKGWLQAYIAAAVTTGEPWPDCPLEPRQPGNVVILQAEDGLADTIRPRLDDVGADVRRVFAIRGVVRDDGHTDGAVDIRADAEALRAEIVRRDAVVAFVDPVTAYLPDGTDSHRDADVRRVMAGLAAIAEQTDCAVVCIRHFNKQTGGKAMYRGGGSIAFTALARAVWSVSLDPDDPERRLLLPVKLNIARFPSGLAYRIDNGVHFDPEPVTIRADDVESRDDGTTATDRQEACAWLTDALADGAIPAVEIFARAKKDGISRRTLERAKASLGIRSRRVGERWVWEPLTDTANAATNDVGGLGGLAAIPDGASDPANTANTATPDSGGVDDLDDAEVF